MLKQLNERERFAIYIGLGAIVIFLVVQWGILPMMDHRRQAARQVAVKRTEIAEMAQLQKEYRRIQAGLERNRIQLQKRPPAFSLFSYLDGLAGTIGLKNKIVYMKPTTVEDPNAGRPRSRVEMKIREVTLEQISRFLFRVETSPNMVRVTRMSITQKQQGKGLLEAVFQVETPEG
jgi:hypothetical protein